MNNSITWQEFRCRYARLHTNSLKSRADAESRLNVIERILSPAYLSDVANTETLVRLQNLLLQGAECRPIPRTKKGQARPRSPHTVRTFMAVLIAALRWANYMGMIDAVPKFRHLKVAKVKHMKGRPITEDEMKAMLQCVELVVKERQIETWQFILRGLWCSGLRLGELLNVHWNDTRFITPCWKEGMLPTLRIPSAMQKNETEESIPLLPEFEDLLLEVPPADRTGWVFKPMWERKIGIKAGAHCRMRLDCVSRIISKIGQRAGVVVSPAGPGRWAKYASAHDLRRTCADRLIAAGVPERDVSRIMRHSSVETTRRYYAPVNVQRSARIIRECILEGKKPQNEPTIAPAPLGALAESEQFIDRLDQKWLIQAIREVEGDKDVVASGSWVVRVDAVKRRFAAIVKDASSFPWSDAVVIDLWGAV